MLCKILIIFNLLGLMDNDRLILGIHGYDNHKDMSEFCKRQVSPSILFGASLDDNHMNVIYYSKLNVPYSCMVTIRTEPPYVIVLVLDVISELNLSDVCSKNQEPMTVYHMLPTYGGYWGPLPDHVKSTHNKTNHTRVYTLKTTTETTTSLAQEDQTENYTETLYTEKIPTWVEEFVVTKEIPLINVSGNFQLQGRPIQHVDDLLDSDDDVTPKKGEDYVTALVPLVQFSPITKTGRQMDFNSSNGNPFYDLIDYYSREDSITIDPRPRITTNKMYYSLRVLQDTSVVSKSKTSNPWQVYNNNNVTVISKKIETNHLLKNISPVNIILEKNDSLSIITTDESIATTKKSFLMTTYLNNYKTTIKTKSKTSKRTTKHNPITGELVHRESWENIVKVAPMLATLLNSSYLPHNESAHLSQESNAKSGNRRRRSFQPVDFELAEPRRLDNSVEDDYDKSELNSYLLMYNMHMLDNFEKTDEDMVEGRKSMQNLTSNRGDLILNICDLQQQGKTQWIKVLDTSEIIVSVNNFTLNHVKLIVTPGFILFKPKEQCQADHVECQINDTRVCIERTLACDSVPNCGSISTDDEDRVSCGLEAGARHVAVAALGCLLVVLAAVYTLHYWVSRCVPRVAEGFFVYTDQSENTLLLHTVMRSPNDDEEEPESFSGQFSFVDLTNLDIQTANNKNLCKRMIRKWVNCIICKKIKEGSAEVTNQANNIEQIELTEKELQKVVPQKDEIIQTESSLEIKTINFNDRLDAPENNYKSSKELDFIKYVNENARTLRSSLELKNNLASNSPELLHDIIEESEIESTVYERKTNLPVLLKSKPEPKNENRSEIITIESVEKHLRFLENPTLIPDQPNQSDSQNFEIDNNNRPSFSGIDSRRPSTNIERKESKEYSRNYWKLPIGKKSKKPPKK